MRFELKTLSDYSNEALLSELRRVGQQLGSENLTRSGYDKVGKVHSSTLGKRFGSWLRAVEAAGITSAPGQGRTDLDRASVMKAISSYAQQHPDCSPTIQLVAERLGVHRDTITKRFGKWEDLLSEIGLTPVPLGRRYTDRECLENILELWTHYGRQPNFAELNRPPSRVGSKAYIRRWGGWRAALAAFVEYANSDQPEESIEEASYSAPRIGGETVLTESQVRVSRSISLSIRYKVRSRDRFRCTACGKSPSSNPGLELHIDHINTWSRGGDNTLENLRVLCLECNLGKGDRLFDT